MSEGAGFEKSPPPPPETPPPVESPPVNQPAPQDTATDSGTVSGGRGGAAGGAERGTGAGQPETGQATAEKGEQTQPAGDRPEEAGFVAMDGTWVPDSLYKGGSSSQGEGSAVKTGGPQAEMKDKPALIPAGTNAEDPQTPEVASGREPPQSKQPEAPKSDGGRSPLSGPEEKASTGGFVERERKKDPTERSGGQPQNIDSPEQQSGSQDRRAGGPASGEQFGESAEKGVQDPSLFDGLRGRTDKQESKSTSEVEKQGPVLAEGMRKSTEKQKAGPITVREAQAFWEAGQRNRQTNQRLREEQGIDRQKPSRKELMKGERLIESLRERESKRQRQRSDRQEQPGVRTLGWKWEAQEKDRRASGDPQPTEIDRLRGGMSRERGREPEQEVNKDRQREIRSGEQPTDQTTKGDVNVQNDRAAGDPAKEQPGEKETRISPNDQVSTPASISKGSGGSSPASVQYKSEGERKAKNESTPTEQNRIIKEGEQVRLGSVPWGEGKPLLERDYRPNQVVSVEILRDTSTIFWRNGQGEYIAGLQFSSNEYMDQYLRNQVTAEDLIKAQNAGIIELSPPSEEQSQQPKTQNKNDLPKMNAEGMPPQDWKKWGDCVVQVYADGAEIFYRGETQAIVTVAPEARGEKPPFAVDYIPPKALSKDPPVIRIVAAPGVSILPTREPEASSSSQPSIEIFRVQDSGLVPGRGSQIDASRYEGFAAVDVSKTLSETKQQVNQLLEKPPEIVVRQRPDGIDIVHTSSGSVMTIKTPEHLGTARFAYEIVPEERPGGIIATVKVVKTPSVEVQVFNPPDSNDRGIGFNTGFIPILYQVESINEVPEQGQPISEVGRRVEPTWVESESLSRIARTTAVDIIVGFVPVAGEFADLAEAATGHDKWGRNLSLGERALAGVAGVLPFVSKGALGSLFRFGKSIGKEDREILNLVQAARMLDAEDIKQIEGWDAMLKQGGEIPANEVGDVMAIMKKLSNAETGDLTKVLTEEQGGTLSRIAQRGHDGMMDDLLEELADDPQFGQAHLDKLAVLSDQQMDALAAIRDADEATGGLGARNWFDVLDLPGQDFRNDLLDLVAEIKDVTQAGLAEAVGRGLRPNSNDVQGVLGHFYAARTLKDSFPDATLSFEVQLANREVDIVLHQNNRNINVEVKTNLGLEPTVDTKQITKDLLAHIDNGWENLLYLYAPQQANNLQKVEDAMLRALRETAVADALKQRGISLSQAEETLRERIGKGLVRTFSYE